MSGLRGRRIELMPVTARDDLPCGLLIATGQADYILYNADTEPLHRRHILTHEFAHLLFDHVGSTAVKLASAKVLMPHLAPSLVERVLGRTVYTEPQEQEAELLASMILSRSRTGGGPAASAQTSGHWLDSLLTVPEAVPEAAPGFGSAAGVDG
ncbi:ParH-like protein [Streptacidiphilus cavernicola]|uniref:ParH-like protein n=1 Tax=Streptacidiphilus cavernicola TaxID=3342716 RepID=A0ABV6VZ91_9ACTN